MKLYILLGSLFKFQHLYDDSYYLREVLQPTNSNVFLIETNDIGKLEKFLEKENIKYKIKED